MPNPTLYATARVMTLQPACLDNIEGFAAAHLEQLRGGEKVVIGTFKGERAFHDAHKGTSARMTYRGFVKDEGVLYRAEVLVSVRIQVRAAKFKSAGPIVVWEKVENA